MTERNGAEQMTAAQQVGLQPVEDQAIDSQSIIEAFLGESSGDPTKTPQAEVDWHTTPLPAGHQSGFAVVVGRPNVGKSTLVNALIGHKVSIVSRKAQTTRTRVTGILTEPQYQLIFVDTPGIHSRVGHKVNQLMIEQAISALPDADVILFVVDVSVSPREEDRHIARLLAAKTQKRPVIFVMNKMDQLDMRFAQKNIENYWRLLPDYVDSIPTSGLDGTNVDVLREHLLTHIPEGPRYYPGGQLTDQTEYKIAAELIREAVLNLTHQEIPHATAVLIEDYAIRDNGAIYIAANIWVERQSQKPIIIGKGGRKLKRIGSVARKELERFVGSNVFLDLWVKVIPKWRDHEARLRELGF